MQRDKTATQRPFRNRFWRWFQPDRLDYAMWIAILVLGAALATIIVQWQQPRSARIVYLGPMSDAVQNLWELDLSKPNQPRRLTDSADSVLGYDITPDGQRIVYSEVIYTEGQVAGTTRLSVLDVALGRSTAVYECQAAACSDLAWRPDGGAFAFQRVDVGGSTINGPGAARLWIYDMVQGQATPLFRDNQQLGMMPRWSPDARLRRLAFVSASENGIVIHDFAANVPEGHDPVIPINSGKIGAFSPDGRWLVYPKIIVDSPQGQPATQAEIHLMLADMQSGIGSFPVRALAPDDQLLSDLRAAWLSDSAALIVARQPASHKIDEGQQLYRIDLRSGKSGSTTLLLADNSGELDNLSVNGSRLLYQRVPLGSAEPRPEIWMLDLASGKPQLITRDATMPRWLGP